MMKSETGQGDLRLNIDCKNVHSNFIELSFLVWFCCQTGGAWDNRKIILSSLSPLTRYVMHSCIFGWDTSCQLWSEDFSTSDCHYLSPWCFHSRIVLSKRKYSFGSVRKIFIEKCLNCQSSSKFTAYFQILHDFDCCHLSSSKIFFGHVLICCFPIEIITRTKSDRCCNLPQFH
jgi:hypothetical protein